MMQIQRHLVAATPSARMLEYIPWIRHIFVEPATVEDGFFQIPQRPGAGTEIKPEAYEQFRVQ
jgi:L-alanine-DL-glutamate epimerase-like enolase superfamily enzyme